MRRLIYIDLSWFYKSLLVLLFIGQSLHAQQNDNTGYAIKIYNDETSVMQNSVTGMSLDKKGYLWIGTQYGIFRFDGRNFTTINSFNNPVLKYNRISSVAADADQNIYFTDE